MSAILDEELVVEPSTRFDGAGNELILASMEESPGRHDTRWQTVISLLLEAGA